MNTDIRTAIVLICITAILTIVMRLRHNYVKKWQRRCTCHRNELGNPVQEGGTACEGFTHREYRMVPDEAKKQSRVGEWFIWFVFDVCDVCGHVKLVKGGPDAAKFFGWWKLIWRRMTDPKQFRSAEDLLVRAGLLRESVPPIADRLRSHVSGNMRPFAGPLRAALDRPPEGTHTKHSGKWKAPLVQRPMYPRRFNIP